MTHQSSQWRDARQDRPSIDEVVWYRIAGNSARLFRPGEAIRAGDPLGKTPDGDLILANHSGRITTIQYDLWQDAVSVEVAA